MSFNLLRFTYAAFIVANACLFCPSSAHAEWAFSGREHSTVSEYGDGNTITANQAGGIGVKSESTVSVNGNWYDEDYINAYIDCVYDWQSPGQCDDLYVKVTIQGFLQNSLESQDNIYCEAIMDSAISPGGILGISLPGTWSEPLDKIETILAPPSFPQLTLGSYASTSNWLYTDWTEFAKAETSAQVFTTCHTIVIVAGP